MSLFQKFDFNDLQAGSPEMLELRAHSDGEISGYASTFGLPADSHGHVIQAGAFKRGLKELESEGISPAMLWAHRRDQPIGKWIEVRENSKGLYVRGRINKEVQAGREALALIQAGDINGLSIGVMVAEGGRAYDSSSGIWTLTDLHLMEVSVVTFPANKRARLARPKQIDSKSDLVDLLRDGGLSKSYASRVAAGGWPAVTGKDHSKALDLAAMLDRATANLKGR